MSARGLPVDLSVNRLLVVRALARPSRRTG